MRVTRRGFLGVTAGVAGATYLTRSALSRADEQAAAVHPPVRGEKRVPSICQQCPGGCGVLVRVVDEQVVGVSGNPVHPINRGGLCPRAFGALEMLRSPRLLSGPRVRDGARGHLKEATWEQAIGQVVQRLGELRQQGLGHTVGILGGEYRGSRELLWQRFAQAYGTPNSIRIRASNPEVPSLAHRFMHGATTPWAYDLEQAKLVVSFGASLFESWVSPVYAARTMGSMRAQGGGRLIQIEPRRSLTATKADRWVPIAQGTDGVLALGIAGVLVREGLYDREFVEERCYGFDSWEDDDGHKRRGFKDLVLHDYGLLSVSQITGVPVDTIIEIARTLGETRPAVAIGEGGPAYGSHDLQTRMAIHSLNALVGNFGVPGGVVASGELPLQKPAAVELDEVAKKSLAQPRIDGAGKGEYLFLSDAPQALAGSIQEAKPYGLNALLLFATNPFVDHPTSKDLAKAIEKVPFVVSFSSFEDETTKLADVVLPDALPMERWQDDAVSYLAGFSCYSVGSPIVAPGRQAKDAADTLLAIAAGVGGPVAKALPWPSFDQVIRDVSKGLLTAERGYVATEATAESMQRILEHQGYWVPQYQDFDAFWDALTERGAWADPTAALAGHTMTYPTPSRKIELYETALARVRVEAARHQGPTGALAQELKAEAEKLSTFPLRLTTYRPVVRPLEGTKDQAWLEELEELPAAQRRSSWRSCVQIHPKTAMDLGVHDGEEVVVESEKGSAQLPAWVSAGVRPDVVCMPLGALGPNPNDLISNEVDPFGGLGLLGTTRVRIRRA